MKFFKKKYNVLLLCLVAIFLPWDTIIGNILIAISTLYSLIYLIKKKVFKKSILNINYLVTTSILLMYFIGIFYSDNQSYGFSFVQTSITLLFFPLMFSSVRYTKVDLKSIILSFIISYSIRSFYVLILLIREVFSQGQNQNWYFQKIIHLGGFHSTYMSVYSIVAMILLLYLINEKRSLWYYFLIFFHGLFLFVLASRMALIALVIILVIYFINIFINNKQFRKHIFISVLLATVVMSIFSYNNHDLKYKFLQLRNINNLKYNKYDASSIASRIAKWEAAINIFNQNNKIIGTGTGDLPEDLLKQFYQIDCLQCIVKKYNNPHNQYLDSLSRNGIIGLVVLLILLIYPIIIAVKSKNIYHLMFLLTFVLMFTTECLLNREKGVQLFGFFYTFFYLLNNKSLYEK